MDSMLELMLGAKMARWLDKKLVMDSEGPKEILLVHEL